MKIIREYEIQLSLYHNEIVGRLAYRDAATGEGGASALYSLDELNNVLSIWRSGVLSGSFAIGTYLAQNASFRMVQEVKS